jgi:hypothetical protein
VLALKWIVKMLTGEEIKKVRRSLVTISIGNVHKIIKGGGIKPILLDNGYKVSFSLDVVRENLRLLHLSTSNTKGVTDVNIAQSIAKDVIGEDFQIVGSMNVKNVIHFMKVEKEDTMSELMKGIDDRRI